MEETVQSGKQLVQELRELRARVQYLEALNRDRERVEQALRLSEERFRAIVAASPLGIVAMDTEGRVTLWNPAAERIFGWSEAEALGGPLPYVTEEMREDHATPREPVLGGATLSGVEVRGSRKDGSPIDISVFTAPLVDAAGTALGVMSINLDVTERRRLRDERLAEKRFTDSVLNSLPGLFYLFDEAGRMLRWNRNLERISGYSAEEIGGMGPLELIAPEDAAAVSRVIAQVFEQGESRVEARFLTRDATQIPCLFTGTRLDLDGRQAIAGMGTDISQRKAVEDAYRASKERMSQALRAANAGAWEWNIRTNRAVWSDENYLVLGLEPGRVASKYENWLRMVHPEDRDAVEQLVAEAVEHRTDLDISFRVVWPDGSVRWINDRGKLVYDESGEPLGMYGIQLDITDRKLAEMAVAEGERSYREIFNGTKDAIFIHDPDTGAIEDVNQGMLDMFGCSREEALGHTADDFSLGSAPYDKHAAIEKVRSALGEGPQTFEWMSRRTNGELFWSEVVLKSARIGGRPRVLAVVRDVSARREAEQQLRVSLEEKEILLREVHHRVKNNLQVISSLLDLQAGTARNPEVLEVLRDSRQRVMTMASIHERLYGSGGLSALVLNGYLEDLAQAIVQAHRPDGTIAVRVDIPAISLSANAAVPLGLIVNELVSNSLKHAFGRDQTGRVRIVVRPADEDRLTLVVEDDGRGLPGDFDIGRVGSLGLTIVKVLVKQLGGTLEVQRGAGASFRIAFADRP